MKRINLKFIANVPSRIEAYSLYAYAISNLIAGGFEKPTRKASFFIWFMTCHKVREMDFAKVTLFNLAATNRMITGEWEFQTKEDGMFTSCL
jgi:hypothetical protein